MTGLVSDVTRRVFVPSALAVALFAVLGVAAAACSGGGSSPTPTGIELTDPVPNPTATPVAIVTSFEGEVREFEINMAANGSPQQGTAVFTRRNDFAHIEVKVIPGGPAQSVTLRRGTCPNPEGFVESLDLMIGGIMRQELRDMPFDDLLAGDLTLVVNPNTSSFNVITACGDLPRAE